MAHTHDVYDMENHFEINGSSRFIKETSETKLVVVQGDHKSEVLTFKMPRYIDGHDMTLCNKIRIHYINLDTKTNNKSADVYEVTDLTLCEECEDVLTFTWTIEAPATKYSGTLSFLVKFECTEGENVLYQWNTAKYVSVNVLAGIDNSEEFVEKYSNVLEEWYNELTKGADSIEELNQQALAEIELAKEDAKSEIEQFSTDTYTDFVADVDRKTGEALASIPEEYATLDAEVKEVANSAIRYTRQALTDEQKAQARENIGAVTCDVIVDDQGNMLPIEQANDTYSANGVTITHKDGVFTFNGTSTNPASVEIVPRYTPYATLKAGETYQWRIKAISGEANGIVFLYVNTDNEVITQQGTNSEYPNTKTFAEDKVLTRFALNLQAGKTFTDFKVVPYLGQNYTDDYAGIVKTQMYDVVINELQDEVNALQDKCVELQEKCDELQNDVSELQNNVGDVLPNSFIEERDDVVAVVQSNDADLRLIAFADPHSIDVNKYKKYNDLLSNGSFDGIIGLGDYNAYSSDTRDKTISNLVKTLNRAGRTQNCFYAIGNHDIAFKSPNSGAVTKDNVLTKKEMYECTCRHLNGVANYNDNDTYGGYYYVDYTASKIRMVVINTSDIYESNGNLEYKYTESVMIQQPQVTWFVEKALDFSDKENPSAWSVLVCCHSNFIKEMFSDILSAVKSGASINKTWTFARRLVGDGSATVNTANPVTITANKDFSKQGAVDVIGVLYGHDHQDISQVISGIQFVGFICDNSRLDDYYVANVDGMLAGGYYFADKNGTKFGFTLSEDVPNASAIGYNDYLVDTGSTTIRIQNSDGITIKNLRAYTSSYASGMTEITNFAPERIADTASTESCYVVNIDKDSREILIVPYGTGVYRAVQY